jgi:acetoin:2,6-dichlorophenolindophenol oxidoreductase subunit alpha
VLEDNGWAQSTPRSLNLAGEIAPRFEAFGLPVVEVETTDVLEVDAAAEEAVSGCRARRGPGVLVIHTYRLCHHSKNDDNRPVDEVQARWAFDPLVVHGARLTEDERADIDGEVEQALEECVGRVLQL